MRIFINPRHHLHDPSLILQGGQPLDELEVPARVQAILAGLSNAGGHVVCPAIDHGREPIAALHDPNYLVFLESVFAQNKILTGSPEPVLAETFAPRHYRRRPGNLPRQAGFYCYGVDNPILAGTWIAAYWSAQCALTAASALLRGERAVYALCRPPGHHAAADLHGGYCYLNNAAIAARFLGQRGKGTPVAILDIDYHHGNGTQEIFYQDPSVLFCSLHIHPDLGYPYFWGEESERGAGQGEGFNYNWTLAPNTDDLIYLRVLEQALQQIQDFSPGFLIVSVGYDILQGDPVGCFQVTEAGLRDIGRLIAGLSIPTQIVQEGGYLLDQLGAQAAQFLSAFEG